MTEPTTRPSVRMTEAEIWSFLTEGHTGILTTLRADGMPVAMPVWYAVVDRAVVVMTRGRKLERLRRDPRASFLVEAGERWAELRAVHLTGRAEVLDAAAAAALGPAVDAELDRKYAAFRTDRAAMPDATRGAYEQAERGMVRLTPDQRVLHWDNRKLGLA
ncbi:pyridoxamine 5'-phosphate oxidase family protein [Pseudonocardia sp. NPDC049154]|uniref:pyridoxamine 5'-phosphate oxidase family protein n=1 Tax=Pseudonocardia sp. NPDC049154 TaxID=3155501 RepID=UPI0033EF5B64